MRKTLHRFLVRTSDDAHVGHRTNWKLHTVCSSRKAAWAEAKRWIKARGSRHVQVIEERIYKGAD